MNDYESQTQNITQRLNGFQTSVNYHEKRLARRTASMKAKKHSIQTSLTPKELCVCASKAATRIRVNAASQKFRENYGNLANKYVQSLGSKQSLGPPLIIFSFVIILAFE